MEVRRRSPWSFVLGPWSVRLVLGPSDGPSSVRWSFVRGHSGFTKRLRLAYPAAPATPTLRDIQHALAREHGYENWKTLVTAISEQSPPAEPRGGDPVSNFLGFASWDHLTHGRGDYATIAAAAMRLLDKHPEIASADIYSAVVCGNRARVEQLLNEQPSHSAACGRGQRRPRNGDPAPRKGCRCEHPRNAVPRDAAGVRVALRPPRHDRPPHAAQPRRLVSG